jgi:hypothetical protein
MIYKFGARFAINATVLPLPADIVGNQFLLIADVIFANGPESRPRARTYYSSFSEAVAQFRATEREKYVQLERRCTAFMASIYRSLHDWVKTDAVARITAWLANTPVAAQVSVDYKVPEDSGDPRFGYIVDNSAVDRHRVFEFLATGANGNRTVIQLSSGVQEQQQSAPIYTTSTSMVVKPPANVENDYVSLQDIFARIPTDARWFRVVVELLGVQQPFDIYAPDVPTRLRWPLMEYSEYNPQTFIFTIDIYRMSKKLASEAIRNGSRINAYSGSITTHYRDSYEGVDSETLKIATNSV